MLDPIFEISRRCGGRFVLARGTRGGSAERFSSPFSVMALLQPLLGDHSAMARLRQFCVEVAPPLPESDNQMIEVLAHLIYSGRLKVMRSMMPAVPAHRAGGRASIPAAGDVQKLGKALEKDWHWIEIELVDKNGAQVPGARYSITTADGREYVGTTDSMGRARISDISGGICAVKLPDLCVGDSEPPSSSSPV